jgi:hypothetical protein
MLRSLLTSTEKTTTAKGREYHMIVTFGSVRRTKRIVLLISLACLEHTIAADGWLRAYLRLNLRLLLFLLVPSAAVLIRLACITPIFGSLKRILGLMEAGSRSLMMTAAYGLVTLVIVSVAISAIVAFLRRK